MLAAAAQQLALEVLWVRRRYCSCGSSSGSRSGSFVRGWLPMVDSVAGVSVVSAGC
jgi:hypothetical protein